MATSSRDIKVGGLFTRSLLSALCLQELVRLVLPRLDLIVKLLQLRLLVPLNLTGSLCLLLAALADTFSEASLHGTSVWDCGRLPGRCLFRILLWMFTAALLSFVSMVLLLPKETDLPAIAIEQQRLCLAAVVFATAARITQQEIYNGHYRK